MDGCGGNVRGASSSDSFEPRDYSAVNKQTALFNAGLCALWLKICGFKKLLD